MTQRTTVACLFLLFFNWNLPVRASHIVGGNLQLTAKPGSNQYNLSLRLFVDEQNSLQGDIKPTLRVTIYRSRDNLKMGDYDLPFLSQTPLKASNQICALLRPLKLAEVQYGKEVELDPDRFNDPDGYYVVHGICCRSPIVDNITQPDQSGMVFHLEFPPLKSIPDSSPVFSVPTGEYACKDQPFAFSFRAVDSDGDQLRYSIVTPYKGFTNQGVAFSNQPSSSYPTVDWRAGFSAAGAVPGNPGLQIDAASGQLSVTANRVGLFTFTVLCEEFRNGQRIGSVRRDFQLVVVDCPKETPPVPVITLQKAPPAARITTKPDGALTGVAVCQGQSVVLKTDSTADWTFQWQRDGQDLPGDTAASLAVKEAGSYTVVKRFRNTCGKPSPAQSKVVVEVGAAHPLKLTAGGPTTFCRGGAVELKAPEGTYTYQWFKNNQPLTGALGATYRAEDSGHYRVVLTGEESGCSASDSLLVRVMERPAVTLTVPKNDSRCEGDTLLLTAPDRLTYRYQWTRNGNPIAADGPVLKATQSGRYGVSITDTNQCQASSEGVDIQFQTAPEASMELLPPVCEGSSQRIPLRATPVGGVFSGPGVLGAELDPSNLKAGTYAVTYSVANSAGGCPGRAQRTIVVNPVPVLSVSDVSIMRGKSITLNESGSDTLQYRWSPPDGLNDPTAAHPVATTLYSTTYQLTATSRQGCLNTARLTVSVVTALYIPDVFTPNGDGTNDVWEIRGLDEYPDCVVEVYNRWGNCLFSSKGYARPWDGRFDGQEVPSAVYHYVIKTGGKNPVRSGSVFVLR